MFGGWYVKERKRPKFIMTFPDEQSLEGHYKKPGKRMLLGDMKARFGL